MTTQERRIAKCVGGDSRNRKCDTCKDRFICMTTVPDWAHLNIPDWLVTVPNTEEGRKFMVLLKKYLNKERYRLVRYGRGKRVRERFHRRRPPIAQADAVAIYVKPSELAKRVESDRQRYNKQFAVPTA